MLRLNVGMGRALLGGAIANFTPSDLENKWAWYRQGQGITGALNVSQWDDGFGLGHHLLQASGAAQPIYLPNTGSKYLWLPKVAGNYASTPDQTITTADIDIKVRVALDDYTLNPNPSMIAQDDGVGRDWIFLIKLTGEVYFAWWDAANNLREYTTTAKISDNVSDGAPTWLRVTLDADNGSGGHVVMVQYAADAVAVPSSWTTLDSGNTGAFTTSIRHQASAILIGANFSTSTNLLLGKVYRAMVAATIGGAAVIDFNPALAADDATSFVAATGETWTINSTGAKKAQIVGQASILADGAAHYMAAAATLPQPFSFAMVARFPTWTLNDVIFDGVSATAKLYQSATTPRIRLNAGSDGTEEAGLALNTFGMIAGCLNGASSWMSLNGGAPVTFDAGSNAPDGITLFASRAAAAFGNVQMRDDVFTTGDIAPYVARMYRYYQRQGTVA